MTKILQCRFKQSFGTFNLLTAYKCSDMGLFSDLSNTDFCGLEFHEQITSEAHLFFQSIQNFMQILEMQKKIQKKSFISR